ncbi:MAG TPA: hypothetical protein PKA27_14480 [Fimbriimonadaceae bacterium]|nr:hypothetical protein [Fimbriimonadaceae bacterium]
MSMIIVLCVAFVGLGLLSGNQHVVMRLMSISIPVLIVAGVGWFLWDRWHRLH